MEELWGSGQCTGETQTARICMLQQSVMQSVFVLMDHLGHFSGDDSSEFNSLWAKACNMLILHLGENLMYSIKPQRDGCSHLEKVVTTSDCVASSCPRSAAGTRSVRLSLKWEIAVELNLSFGFLFWFFYFCCLGLGFVILILFYWFCFS